MSTVKSDLDPTSLETVNRCIEMHLRAHDLELPGRPLDVDRDFVIVTEITFPIREQHIYQLIREAAAPNAQ